MDLLRHRMGGGGLGGERRGIGFGLVGWWRSFKGIRVDSSFLGKEMVRSDGVITGLDGCGFSLVG